MPVAARAQICMNKPVMAASGFNSIARTLPSNDGLHPATLLSLSQVSRSYPNIVSLVYSEMQSLTRLNLP